MSPRSAAYAVCVAVVERLLGVDSRFIPAAERTVPGGPGHQNVGVFHQVRITGGQFRPEPNGHAAPVTVGGLIQH